MPKGAENRLKYVIVWISGLSDVPTDQLDGKTPLEAADIPCMDSVSRRGRIGLVETMTEDTESGSDKALLSLLGYNPSL